MEGVFNSALPASDWHAGAFAPCGHDGTSVSPEVPNKAADPVCRAWWIKYGNLAREWGARTGMVGTGVQAYGVFEMIVAGPGAFETAGTDELPGAGAFLAGSAINTLGSAQDIVGAGMQWYGGAGSGNFQQAVGSFIVGSLIGTPAKLLPNVGRGALGRMLMGANLDMMTAISSGLIGPPPASCQ